MMTSELFGMPIVVETCKDAPVSEIFRTVHSSLGTLSLKGTSNNCPRASGTPNLPVNDSALFSFRFCAVHPKDARDCLPRQLFEVPLYDLPTIDTKED